MRIRSKALYRFLSDKGVLGGTQEEIALAKREYRKLYKAAWKRNRQAPVRELRPIFTLKEYAELKAIAAAAGYRRPTAYLKQLGLCQVSGTPLVRNRDMLLAALQHLGIAISILEQGGNPHAVRQWIEKAEQTILHYANP